MINWLRKHHFLHDWGKWEFIKEYKNTFLGDPCGSSLIEGKRCQICNKLKTREVSI